MDLEDIIRFQIRNNIEKNCREEYYTHNRMYLYAILFHIHRWSLNRIGELFAYHTPKRLEKVPRNHATIRNALIEAHNIQHTDTFREHTAELQEQFYFLIPPYEGNHNKGKPIEDKQYEITVPLSKEKYINYLKGRDVEEIYEIVYMLTLEKLRGSINKKYAPKKKKS